MSRVQINDLPDLHNLSENELRGTVGGGIGIPFVIGYGVAKKFGGPYQKKAADAALYGVGAATILAPLVVAPATAAAVAGPVGLAIGLGGYALYNHGKKKRWW